MARSASIYGFSGHTEHLAGPADSWRLARRLRFAREKIVKTIGYLEQLAGWGVGWRSYTQPFLDTGNEMTSGIVLSVLAAVAKQERVTISERTKAGLQRVRKAGVRLGRPRATKNLSRTTLWRRAKQEAR